MLYIIFAILESMYRRLREARLAAGLTLSQVATMTGIAQPNLSRIEAGKVDARYSTLARMARALGVELVVAAPAVLTLADVRARMAEGARRLAEHGIAPRDNKQRLEWKQARGVDTTVERRLLG